jgi:hypothetical protein
VDDGSGSLSDCGFKFLTLGIIARLFLFHFELLLKGCSLSRNDASTKERTCIGRKSIRLILQGEGQKVNGEHRVVIGATREAIGP